ncbi:aKG-HExxH-type peptide beta-hydroxylase [Streptomyces ochraceiscleroticus]|uniref:HEXXH motif-containing putative peptide modification protein n=1 Tax=Streptomyces ochraceiscleroticus TaxID=47761 RepID=A0ABW1MJV3_9ACTN|nr:HEXXH motif-containing putative peptide modification protein [Streptomyces ochraceiscleroticus]
MLRAGPDAREAARDEAAVGKVVRSVLASNGMRAPAVLHPSAVAAALTVQSGRRPVLDEDAERWHSEAVATRAGLEPAQPAPHLIRSADRALAALPAGTDKTGGSRVASWRGTERAVLGESCTLLAGHWPQMLAELRACVVQVALLEGSAIDGFTDFATHGAIYINRARLGPSPRGLPGPVRCAEALVHEGTHTRCNAAQLGTPFLTTEAGDTAPVRTPLRSDPRPLAGLFQQAVVLARCAALYERLLEHGTTSATESPGIPERAVGSPVALALASRRDRLSTGARQAIAVLYERPALLTGHGRAVLGECDDLLRLIAA